MGNFIESALLDNPVLPSMTFLTRCKIYLGTSTEISRLFKAYVTLQETPGHHIPKSMIKSISKETPLRGSEEIVYTCFRSPGYNKINFMDLMAAIIAFSVASWQAKVKLSFLTFDFDESKTLTKDEMVIMILCFIRGIGIINNSSISKNIDLEGLAKHCFDVADTNPDGLVTLEELTRWVETTPAAYNLFIKNEQKKKKVIKFPRVKSVKKAPNPVQNRRQSISISFTGRKVVKRLEPRKSRRLSETFNPMELEIMFKKIANPLGTASLGNVFIALAENPKFSEDTDFFFHEFGFDRSKQINFSQLLNFIQKRRSKSGYVLQRGNIRYTEVSTKPSKPIRRNTKVLKHLFEIFDRNKDGVLTFDELSSGFKDSFDPSALLQMFNTYDKDQNKVLDREEFLSLFSNK